jgi:low affinity Fe/Cu permease
VLVDAGVSPGASRPSATLACPKVKTHHGSLFDRFSKGISQFAGHPMAFAAALALIVLWLVAGPIFGFSDTWQLVINTATTIVTFLMVFLIQNTQNRDTEAIQVKLDELLRVTRGAHVALLDLEELEDKELERIRGEYGELARKARENIRHGKSDTGVPRTGKNSRS